MSTRQLRQSYISNSPYWRSLVDLVFFSQILCISPLVEVSLGKKAGIPTPLFSPNSEVSLAVKKSTTTDFYSLPLGGLSCIVGGNDVELNFSVLTEVIRACRDVCLTTPIYLCTHGGFSSAKLKFCRISEGSSIIGG